MTIWTILLALVGIAGGIFLISTVGYCLVGGIAIMIYKIRHPQYLFLEQLPDEIGEELVRPLLEHKYLKWFFAPFFAIIEAWIAVERLYEKRKK